MNIWITGKNSIKSYYLKKEIFTADYIKISMMQITRPKKNKVVVR